MKSLKALNEPMIGDGLVKSDNDPTFWLAAMMAKGPKLDMKDLKQQAAMPLSSFLRRDPWTDQVITMHAAYEPLLSPADKMPFEVEPVYIKLGYYKPPADAAAAPAEELQPHRAAAAPARQPRLRPLPPGHSSAQNCTTAELTLIQDGGRKASPRHCITVRRDQGLSLLQTRFQTIFGVSRVDASLPYRLVHLPAMECARWSSCVRRCLQRHEQE